MSYLITWSEGEEVEYRIVEDLNNLKRIFEEKNSILTCLEL